jgi:WhiB family redox-sensing transcriptional regulator
MEKANCKGQTAVFYPDRNKTGRGIKPDNRAALTLCASCVVREPCLEFALKNREEFGVWGGTTPRGRRRILTERRMAING